MDNLDLLLIRGPSLVYSMFNTKEIDKDSKKDIPIDCQYSLELNTDNEKREIIASLGVKLDSPNTPFSFDMKSMAVFKINGSAQMGVDNEEQVISKTIPYMFSFLKELVADLTRKAYFMPLYLPTMDLNFKNVDRS